MNCKTIEDCLACSEHQYCSNNKAKYVIKLQKRIEELEKKVGFLEKEMVIEALKAQPCEDAVSREAVLDVVNNPLNIKLDKIIEKLPSVTPKQRTGKWELTDDEQNYRCSCCKNYWISASEYFDVWKYCPNCGAKMEGESE